MKRPVLTPPTLKNRRGLFFWILFTLLIAGIITWFSSQTGDESAEESWEIARKLRPVFRLDDTAAVLYYINFVVRKVAHFCIFAAFGFGLLGCLCYQERVPALPVAACGGILFGALDEFHQSFVPNRAAKLHDVLIDGCGAVAGCIVAVLVLRWWMKRRERLFSATKE